MRHASAFAAAFLLLALAAPARAEDPAPGKTPGENLQLGAGLVCDTQAQAERYVQLFDGDPRAAAEAVNAEAGKPEACTFGIVAYVRGADVAELRDRENKTVRVTEILVVGVATDAGLMEIVPVRWYTVFPAEELKI